MSWQGQVNKPIGVAGINSNGKIHALDGSQIFNLNASSIALGNLPSGGVIQATDATVVVRGGLNYQVTVPVDLIYQNAATLLTKANIASPAFTGVPTAPTAALGTNTTQLATTAFVTTEVALKANLASPAFTGIPTAPTASAGTNTTQLATTAFVATATTGVAPLASPAFTGVPTAPTATAGTNTTQLATTAFVTNAVALKANLASPAFTGTPTAPTAAIDVTTNQVATMAAINQAVTGYESIDVGTAVSGVLTITSAQYRQQWLGFIGTLTGDLIIEFPRLDGKTIMLSNNVVMGSYAITMRMSGQASTNPLYNGISQWILTNTSTSRLSTLIGATLYGNNYYQYDILTSDNSYRIANTAFVQDISVLKANLNSPAFTGTPTAPTATAGTNTTQLATTAFVTTADALKANLASPALTGTPTAPTAAAGTNTTQLATTAFVTNAVTAGGGGIVASGTGWVKFTNGLIMQFFSANVVGGGVSNTITLPTSFTSTSYIPMITQGGVFNINPSGSNNDPQVILGGFTWNPPSGWNNSSFIVTAPHGSTSASSMKCAFFVIGY